MILSLFFSLSIGLLLFSVMMLIRNEIVFKFRIKTLHNDYEKYDMLPSYNKMMYNLKVWNFDKFYKGEK